MAFKISCRLNRLPDGIREHRGGLAGAEQVHDVVVAVDLEAVGRGLRCRLGFISAMFGTSSETVVPIDATRR